VQLKGFPKKSIDFVHLFVFLVSAACSLTALIQYSLKIDSFHVNRAWTFGFYIITAVFIAFSALIFAVRDNRFRAIALVIKTMLILIAGYPLGDYFGVEFSLLCSCVIEACFVFPLPLNVLSASAMILAVIFSQEPATVWGSKTASPSLPDLLTYGAYCLVVMAITVMFRHFSGRLKEEQALTARLNDAIAQLTSANVGFQQYAHLAGEESRLAERKRITREIHDTIGYTLTNIIMMMEAGLDLSAAESAKVRDLLAGTLDQARKGLGEIRTELYRLRSVEGKQKPRALSLTELCQAFQTATKTDIKIEYGNLSSFPESPQTDFIIYRIIQEGLTNAFKHGQASRIRIMFWAGEKGLTINIHDNGNGCDEMKEGIGLQGMRERLEKSGGRVTAANAPDGFELIVFIPSVLERDRDGKDKIAAG
jgi:signal transduction histidine kinase